MKNIYLIITFVLLFTACANKVPQKSNIELVQNFYYIDDFIYKKEQISFFEKEFHRILKLNNKKILQEYANFYRNNQSYFINALEKAKQLENRIKKNKVHYVKNSHKELLTKALSSNKKDAIKIYLKLAKEDNIFAKRELARIYKISDPIKSVFWYEKLILDNDIKSIKDYAYANIYMIRPIIVQNVKKAVQLYEKLEQLGETSALMNLGNIYEYGYFKDDFPQDKEKSLQYYEKAAKKDYTNAQRKLAQIYLCKECEAKRYNKEKGLKLLETLALKGDEYSIKKLETIKQEAKEEEKHLELKEESEK